MAVTNKQLNKASVAKKDDFYTQLSDIEKEMRYYKDYFRGKVVFCNCDDSFESNFFKYFAMNFNSLGIKKLIATSFGNSENKPYKVILTEVKDQNSDGRVDLSDVEYILKHEDGVMSLLQEDGDFRSQECIDLLEQCDVVVTNPPFSLFREYIAQLMEYQKDFIIIGNQNAITYKEIFPLFMANKIWYGASIHSHGRDFRVPDDYPLHAYEYRTDENGAKYINVKGVRWFTNVDYKERHDELVLYKKYNPTDYPKYDTYDAIEVGKSGDIPFDYDGIMGVPISFIDKYNPDQFEIVGEFNHGKDGDFDLALPSVNGKVHFKRIAIRRKQVSL